MKTLFVVVISLFIAVQAFAAPSVIELQPIRDQQNGVPMIGLKAPQWVDQLSLTANVAVTYTIPTGAKYLLFNGTGNFYVSFVPSQAAVITGTSITTGVGAELNPVLRAVSGLTAISIIGPTTGTVVTISAFK
jgi:hypothetical protein